MKHIQVKIILLFAILVSFLSSCQKDCLNSNQCILEPDKGPCRAVITKYYFDTEEERCKEFIWGGCDGTIPFEELADCQKCECN